jgi:hypothetical protein
MPPLSYGYGAPFTSRFVPTNETASAGVANLEHRDVAALFNTVWSEITAIKVVAGMTLHASDAPHKIIRYNSMTEMEIMWCIDFTFNAHGRQHDKQAVKLLGYPGNFSGWRSPRTTIMYIGDMTITKIKGDLDRFMKDFVILKMFSHEWESE